MKKDQPDDIDLKILNLLKSDAKRSNREIGEEVHMSSQAVGDRIRNMRKNGVIVSNTIIINDELLPQNRVDYVTVIMNNSEHDDFLNYVQSTHTILELYRVSGNGCYMMKVLSNDNDAFNDVLENVLKYGNYSINSVIKKHK